PVDDLAIAAVMQHYEALSKVIRIACPEPEVTRRVLNKTETLEAANKCGIRVPRSTTVFNSMALSELAREIPFPWIVKPSDKETRFEEFTSIRFDSLDAITARYPTPREFEPAMLVQEFCEGVGVGVEMLLHEGECLATFQHRRLKELPYSGGVAVTAIAEKPDEALAKVSLRLLKELNWNGVAMVEFRVNPIMREAVLLEVNGRYWGTVSLPVSAGIDFPLYHWQLTHGEKPSIPVTYRAGMRWRWTSGYVHRLYRLLAVARRTPEARAELKRTMSQFFSDFSPMVKEAMFDPSDPSAAINEVAQAVKFLSQHAVSVLRHAAPTPGRMPQKETRL
ncbi:MAG TPA: ATP-grasp domain-containing protein, partial [Terriglobales bacterium]|nr:ATP-grasp domain-containing protein [Terriglobales bacterium]